MWGDLLADTVNPFYSKFADTFCNKVIHYLKIEGSNQGDQIGWFFTDWATFGGSLWFFEKMK